MFRLFLPLVVVTAIACASGCTREPTPAPPIVKVRPPAVKIPDEPRQNLTPAELERFHHLAMGSELVPLTWIKALESKQTGKPFLADIERFGLIADPGNADGLPIGLTAAESVATPFAGKMVGLNCAACHTGEMTYQGKSIRIEGGSSLFFVEAFVKDLAESLVVTIKSPDRLLAFVKRTLDDKEHADAFKADRPDAARLLAALPNLADLAKAGAFETALARRLEELHQAELARPSLAVELDANAKQGRERFQKWLGEIKHGDLAFAVGDAREAGIKQTLDHVVEMMRMMKARLDLMKKVKTEAAQLDPATVGGPGRVDDFGSARNLLFDAKTARPATAPCSVPHLWGTGKLTWTDWDANTQSALGRSVATALAGGAVFDTKSHRSTVKLRNLAELDRLSEKIAPPAWPEDVLGKIDADKAKRGAALFQQHCAKCHGPPDLLFAPEEVGTDPARAHNFAEPLGNLVYADTIQQMIDLYLQRACLDAGIDAAERIKLEGGHPNVWRTTKKYVARPLAAIWATPPYLHNGSVPTLYDLLLPAKDRPATFPLGQRDYDPAKIGFVTEVKGPPMFVFDTSKVGNRNTGHEYGTQLSAGERRDLLEYLKGL